MIGINHQVRLKKFSAKIYEIKLKCKKWNSTFFAFSLIIEGITEKVLQFMFPLK